MAKPKIVPGMTCAYCAVEPAAEVEHIFPLRLIPKDERNEAKSGLVYAPTCGPCNDRKRELEETLTHLLLGDTGDNDQHLSTMKLIFGPFQNAALSNNSPLVNAVGPQLNSAPMLWLPSAKGWELMTFLELPGTLARERLDVIRFMARGLINEAYGIIVPPTAIVSVRAANYMERNDVTQLLDAGRIPVDQRLTRSIGDGIAEWFGAAYFTQPDLSDLRAIIGIDFYRRSFYFASIEPVNLNSI